MGQFLNNKEPYDKFKTVMNGTYFVDKSEILEELKKNGWIYNYYKKDEDGEEYIVVKNSTMLKHK